MKLGLENVREFMHGLDDPQAQFPTIHIAGTNGKGSTTALVTSILSAAGYRVGMYTSPHLVDFRERVLVNGAQIEKRFIIDFVERHRGAASRRGLTFFEVMTALAFDYFRRQKVDIAVIEVGLGGRLDATNVITPVVCAVTEISFDHMNVLGHTLTAIAREKAGIIKRGVPVVIASQRLSARRTLRLVAKRRGAPICALPDRSSTTSVAPHSSLSGAHQYDNLRVALGVIAELRAQGWRISDSAVRNGIRRTRWRGRFEILRARNGATVILDVAHNQSGLGALARAFHQRFPRRKAKTLVGFVRDKELGERLAGLARLSSTLWVTALPTHRSASPTDILANLDSVSIPILTYANCERACRAVMRDLAPNEILLVCGSHYLVGEFLRLFDRNLAPTRPPRFGH